MSRNPMTALVIFLMILVCTPVLAQDTEPQDPESQDTEPLETTLPEEPVDPAENFDLLRDSSAVDDLDIEEEELVVWEPALVGGTVEVSFAFGFLDFNKVLWEHDQIIYKYTTDATSWGDVKIQGQSAFNPVLRIGYNLSKWLSLEAAGGLAITEYTSTITNRRTRDNKPNAAIVDDPPLGEYDAENRSLLTLQASLNAVLYPLNIAGDGKGKLHPYLTVGAGKMWYEMNSNYFDGTSGANDLSAGLGLRLLADENISVRFEVLGHFNSIEFTPADNFTTLDEGTVVVPLNEYPRNDDGSVDEQVVTKYSAQSLSFLNWSIGVHGSF